jgi:hypothetical protein
LIAVAVLALTLSLMGCGGSKQTVVTVTTSTPASTTADSGVEELNLALADSPEWLSDAAIDAAASFVVVMASKDDTPTMGNAYDELANWMNGVTSMTAKRVKEDIALICAAPSAACKPATLQNAAS